MSDLPRYRLRALKYVPPTNRFGKGAYVKTSDIRLEQQPHKRGGWVKWEDAKLLIDSDKASRSDKVLRDMCEYLNNHPENSIGAGSWFHNEMKDILS